MKLLSKADILKTDDLPATPVDVPEWGGTVMVRTMTGRERDQFEQETFGGDDKNLSNIRARLCGLCMVDDLGERIFADEEIDTLGQKSAGALDRVFRVAQQVNGLAPGAVEALEKN